jgi:hypothetical protein
METLVKLVRRTYRFLLVGLVVFTAAGPAQLANAAVLNASTGSTGPIQVADSSASAGASCYYDTQGLLYKIVVVAPRMFAAANYAQQPVSFRARAQWWYADGTQDVVDSNAAIFVHSAIAQATTTSYAPLGTVAITYQVSPTATLRAGVEMVAEWRNPSTNSIQGARSYFLTYYHEFQNRADGSHAFRGNTTGTCPVRLG